MRREVGHFYMRQMARNRRNSYYEFAIVDGHRQRALGRAERAIADWKAIGSSDSRRLPAM